MPGLDFDTANATLSSCVEPVDSGWVRLTSASTGDSWRTPELYSASGTITFENFEGWALRLPPHTFEPLVRFARENVIPISQFGSWTDWAVVAGVTSITESIAGEVYGTELSVARDTGVATSTVSRTMDLDLRANDVMEFRVYLPANADALSIVLHSGAGSATYVEHEPVSGWNIVVIEIDQPTSTSAPWTTTAVDAASITVGFDDFVASNFLVASSEWDRTAEVGGEVRWQVSLDDGVTWEGWDGTAWTAGVWCHPTWAERRLADLSPGTAMQLSVRCQVEPSTNLRYSPEVRGLVCGLDFDTAFHPEEDLKRSVARAIETSTIYLRGLSRGDGSTLVTFKTNFQNSTVTHVYLGDFDSVDTTTDVFSAQSAETEIPGGWQSTLTLTGVVASGSPVVIHYEANPTVKISADRFVIEAEVPEVNLVFPTVDNEQRHSATRESFRNRALGYVYSGSGANFEDYTWEIYLLGQNSMMISAMHEAIRRLLEAEITSDATGFPIGAGDILPSDVESDRRQGLHVRRIAVESIIGRWQDLTLTREAQVRAVLPSFSRLS